MVPPTRGPPVSFKGRIGAQPQAIGISGRSSPCCHCFLHRLPVVVTCLQEGRGVEIVVVFELRVIGRVVRRQLRARDGIRREVRRAGVDADETRIRSGTGWPEDRANEVGNQLITRIVRVEVRALDTAKVAVSLAGREQKYPESATTAPRCFLAELVDAVIEEVVVLPDSSST